MKVLDKEFKIKLKYKRLYLINDELGEIRISIGTDDELCIHNELYDCIKNFKYVERVKRIFDIK